MPGYTKDRYHDAGFQSSLPAIAHFAASHEVRGARPMNVEFDLGKFALGRRL